MSNFLGQHFLKNSGVIKKIIAALEPRPGERIIEIGPGHGELTIPLAESSSETGVKIIAIEKDKKLAEALVARIENLKLKNVEVVAGDVLDILKTITASSSSAPTQAGRVPGIFKIGGNIPYYLTGHLLRIVSELEAKPERAVFMIQEEVARRIVVAPPRMNRLAASVQFWADAKIIARVPREDFSPAPKVDSAVIELRAKARTGKNSTSITTAAAPTSDQYYAMVRALFAQPRKTVLNNLFEGQDVYSNHHGKIETPEKNKEEIAKILEKIGINPKSRPQDMTVELISALALAVDSSVHK
jgi:16S rRNA (adenine1518-N6/adenine1519-N6)-dimethyltransferase